MQQKKQLWVQILAHLILFDLLKLVLANNGTLKVCSTFSSIFYNE